MAEHKKPRRSAEQWGTLIDEYRQSGLKAGEFCSTRDLALGTFRKWLYQDRAASPENKNKKERFSPIVVKDQGVSNRTETICIHLNNGIRIDCASSMSIDAIARLALAVRHGY